MKHKVTMLVETEKRGLFGKKKVLEKRVVQVDGKTYRRMKREEKRKPYTIQQMMLFNWLLDQD